MIWMTPECRVRFSGQERAFRFAPIPTEGGVQGVELVPRDSGLDPVAAMRALSEGQQLRERAEVSCRECLRSAAAEGGLDGLAAAEVQAVYERSALVFDHGIFNHPFVETRFGLYVADPVAGWFRGLRAVGHYRLITRLDGSVEDDYLVLDPQRHAEPS